MSRHIDGWIKAGDACLAAYRVHWTLGQVPRHGATFYLVLGPAGEERIPRLVVLQFKLAGPRSGLAVVDADQASHAGGPEDGRPLLRAEVIGTPLAAEVFALVDVLFAEEERLREVIEAYRRAMSGES